MFKEFNYLANKIGISMAASEKVSRCRKRCLNYHGSDSEHNFCNQISCRNIRRESRRQEIFSLNFVSWKFFDVGAKWKKQHLILILKLKNFSACQVFRVHHDADSDELSRRSFHELLLMLSCFLANQCYDTFPSISLSIPTPNFLVSTFVR